MRALSPSHRGNLDGFINWCVGLGQEPLYRHALKKGAFEGRKTISTITENCKILGVLEEATELTSPAEVGEPIGMFAYDTGRRLYPMLARGLVEKPDKKRGAYRITPRGAEIPRQSASRAFSKVGQK